MPNASDYPPLLVLPSLNYLFRRIQTLHFLAFCIQALFLSPPTVPSYQATRIPR